jgi:hypothetical protein
VKSHTLTLVALMQVPRNFRQGRSLHHLVQSFYHMYFAPQATSSSCHFETDVTAADYGQASAGNKVAGQCQGIVHSFEIVHFR